MKDIKVYKIYNPVLDLYSQGGSHSYNLWTKKGKTWNNIGHIKNHIAMLKEYGSEGKTILKKYIKDKCIVIELIHIIQESVQKETLIEEFI